MNTVLLQNIENRIPAFRMRAVIKRERYLWKIAIPVHQQGCVGSVEIGAPGSAKPVHSVDDIGPTRTVVAAIPDADERTAQHGGET